MTKKNNINTGFSNDIIPTNQVSLKKIEKIKQKTCDECDIGFWNGYDDARIVTYKELKSMQPSSVYTIQDYCDKRKSTNLSRFNFCPICGSKIDWNKYKKDLNKQD